MGEDPGARAAGRLSLGHPSMARRTRVFVLEAPAKIVDRVGTVRCRSVPSRSHPRLS